MTLALAAALAKQSLDRQMIHIQHFDCWSKRVDICYSRVSCVYVYIFVLVYALTSVPLFWLHRFTKIFLHVKLFKILNMHRQHIIPYTINIQTEVHSMPNKPNICIQFRQLLRRRSCRSGRQVVFSSWQCNPCTGVASTIFVFKDMRRSYPNILNIRAGGYMMVL